MIASLFGPVPGSRHDSGMLVLSELLVTLQEIMPEDGHLGRVYTLYGDFAYSQSMHIIGGYMVVEPGSIEAEFNTAMSKVRECIEWTFKDIIQHWKFFDMKLAMKIFYISCWRILHCGCFPYQFVKWVLWLPNTRFF